MVFQHINDEHKNNASIGLTYPYDFIIMCTYKVEHLSCHCFWLALNHSSIKGFLLNRFEFDHKAILLPEISFVWKEHCIFILNISGSNNGRKVTVWIIALFIISGCNKALSLSLTITEYGLRKYIGLSVYFIAGREAMLTFSSARKGRKRFCDLSWSLEQMGRMNLK